MKPLFYLPIIALVLAGCQQPSDMIVDLKMLRDGSCKFSVGDGTQMPWQDPVGGYSVREEQADGMDRCIIEHRRVSSKP